MFIKDLDKVALPYKRLELIETTKYGTFIKAEKRVRSLEWAMKHYPGYYVYSMKAFYDTKTVSICYGSERGDFIGWF